MKIYFSFRKTNFFLKISILSLLAMTSNLSLASEQLASKLSLSTGFEMLNNMGTAGGSASGSSGFDLCFTSFLNSRLSIGVGYATSFNLGQNTMPTNGYFLQGKYYYLAPGTRVTEKDEWGTSVIHPAITPFVGLSYHKVNYYLGDDPLGASANSSFSGNYSTGNLDIGLDYRIDSQFEWTLQASDSLMTFASSDLRVRIQEMSLLIGLNFIF